VSGFTCFQKLDGSGILVPTIEPEQVFKAWHGMKNLDFHLKMWEEEILLGCLFDFEILEDFGESLPDFVYKRLNKTQEKYYKIRYNKILRIQKT